VGRGAQPNIGGASIGGALQPNPDVRLVCDQMEVTAAPAWRTPTSTMDFEFEIRNEGTEVLQIRAKGG